MKVRVLPLTGAKLSAPLDLSRRGMPALDSIHNVVKFKSFKIVKSTEIDSYEESPSALALQKALMGRQPSSAALTKAMKKPAPKGDNFGGTQRKAAKISIATGKTKTFKTVSALIASLPTDDKMIKRKPKIGKGANSDRVSEEMRNVGVSAAFLYAASREDDNDFHLIIGGDPQGTPEMYITMELSGLPPKTSPAFAKLNTARNAYKKFFGTNLPGMTYDFYSPPIPVKVKGSLFFDVGHATGSRPGPASLKSRMPTVWEVHPITSIELGP